MFIYSVRGRNSTREDPARPVSGHLSAELWSAGGGDGLDRDAEQLQRPESAPLGSLLARHGLLWNRLARGHPQAATNFGSIGFACILQCYAPIMMTGSRPVTSTLTCAVLLSRVSDLCCASMQIYTNLCYFSINVFISFEGPGSLHLVCKNVCRQFQSPRSVRRRYGTGHRLCWFVKQGICHSFVVSDHVSSIWLGLRRRSLSWNRC